MIPPSIKTALKDKHSCFMDNYIFFLELSSHLFDLLLPTRINQLIPKKSHPDCNI